MPSAPSTAIEVLERELVDLVGRKPGNSRSAGGKKKGRTVDWTALDWLNYYRSCGQAISRKTATTTNEDLANDFGLTAATLEKKKLRMREAALLHEVAVTWTALQDGAKKNKRATVRQVEDWIRKGAAQAQIRA